MFYKILLSSLLLFNVFYFKVAFLFFLGLVFLSGYIICLYHKNDPSKKILLLTLGTALLLRCLVSFVNYVFSDYAWSASDIFGDAQAYNGSARYIADVISGFLQWQPFSDSSGDSVVYNVKKLEFQNQLPPYYTYQVSFISYLYAYLYYLFGSSPLMLKYINSFISVLNGYLCFRYLSHIVDKKIAFIGMIFLLFWPSYILWSSSGLKDSIFIFILNITLFTMCHFLKYCRQNDIFYAIKKKYFLLLLLSFYLLLFYFLRPPFFGIILMIVSLSMIGMILSKKKFLFLILIFCIFLPVKTTNNWIQFTKREIENRHFSEGIPPVYRVFPQRFYNSPNMDSIQPLSHMEILTVFLKGAFFFLFSPLPWQVNSANRFLMYMESTALFSLIFLFFGGVYIGLRKYSYYVWPYFISFCVMIFSFGPASFNLGTVFRHRMPVIMIYLIFVTIGLQYIVPQKNYK